MLEELESLKEKIEYEYECFRIENVRSSRDNIFAASREIELKKAIRKYIIDFICNIENKIENSIVAGLLLEDNTLEAIYCVVTDNLYERLIPPAIVAEGIFKLYYAGGKADECTGKYASQ